MEIFHFSFLFYIIISLLIYFSYQDIENVLNSTKTIIPYTLRLLNGNILLVINKGIYFLNSNLEIIDSSTNIIFESELSEDDANKVNFAQFSIEEEGYIMVLALNNIYFFTSEGVLLDNIIHLSDYLNINVVTYSLSLYKKEDNYLHYIISIKNSIKFDIYHFKYDLNAPHSNSLENTRNVDIEIKSESPNLYETSDPRCHFLFISSKKVLVCSYYAQSPCEVQTRVFDPNDDFNEIESYLKYVGTEYIFYFNTIPNEEKDKLFILILIGYSPYSIIYDFNRLSGPKKLLTQEDNKANANYKNRLVYFPETNEYFYVSNRWGNTHIPIIILYGNFRLKEYGEFDASKYNGVFQVKAACPLYDGKDYYLIFDNENILFYGKLGNLTICEIESEEIETQSPILTTIIETTLPSFTKNIKCKTATYESAIYDLCIECDNNNGYYSAQYSDNSFLHGFLECYNMDNKPSNLFFDNSNKIFRQCYKTCKTCIGVGDYNTNNCLICDDNYIKQPDIPDTTNCVMTCNYMYYYTSYGLYKCTSENKCPDEAKFYIEELKKCTDDCRKEEIYKYKYSGKCLKNCPENTEPNEDNICIDTNINSCTKTESEFSEKETLDYDEIDSNAKIYAEDFSYTDKHVNHYYNNLYSILLYKNSYCIDDLSLDMPKVDFGNCYSKVLEKLDPPTKENIIIALVEKFNKDRKSSTTYFFYHPITGEKIDVATICKDEEVVVKESVLSQLNNSNVDLDYALFLADQNIDIFNLSDAFYTDICFYFESPNGKDIPLKDRVKTFYPNVTLCDEGCEIKGVNLTTMESICECKFSDLISFGENALVQNALGGITNLLSSSNIMVFKCYKDIFNKKYFIKNTGGYIFIGIASAEIIISILFFSIEMVKIFQHLYRLTEHFIRSVGQKKNIKNNKKDNYLTIDSTENAPPRKVIENNKIDEKRKSRISKARKFKIISSKDVIPEHKLNLNSKILVFLEKIHQLKCNILIMKKQFKIFHLE